MPPMCMNMTRGVSKAKWLWRAVTSNPLSKATLMTGFTWSSPATWFRDSIVTVTFQPSSNSSTVVEIHQVGLPDEDAQGSHLTGWSECLDQLGRIVHTR